MKFFTLALVIALSVPAFANTMNVTNDSQVTVDTGDNLFFYISLSNSGDRNPTYPGEIEFVLGAMPLGGPVNPIPETSGVYMTGILFRATIQSANGSISIPLTDTNAARLGLPTGDLLMVPGAEYGGYYSGPADLISANIALNSQEAAALFASGEAVIDIQNLGSDVTFGYPGMQITNAFSASAISEYGSQSIGAPVMQADCQRHTVTPEPGTIGLLLLGLAILIPRALHRYSRPGR